MDHGLCGFLTGFGSDMLYRERENREILDHTHRGTRVRHTCTVAVDKIVLYPLYGHGVTVTVGWVLTMALHDCNIWWNIFLRYWGSSRLRCHSIMKMVFSCYKKERIFYFRTRGYKPPTISRLLENEGMLASRKVIHRCITRQEASFNNLEVADCRSW